MGKIVLSPETKAKITESTGLTFLADNIERNCDSSEGTYINEILKFYSTTTDMIKEVEEVVKPAIKEDCPEIEFEPVEPTEKVVLTILITPEDAVVKLNGSEQKSITVDKGTEVLVEAEKEGYKPFSETVTVNENTEKEINLEIGEKLKPSLEVTEILTLEKDIPTEVSATVTPNDYQGVMIKGKIEVSDSSKIKMKYWEPNEEVPSWHDFVPKDNTYIFGPVEGFPCINATSKFRITGISIGELSFKVSLITVDNEEELVSSSNTISIKDSTANLITDEGNELITDSGEKLIL